jgi:DNA-binding FrmR family transcriptional regulator
MKNSKQLLNNIVGQLNGISKMMDNKEKACKDVITQLKAVKSATSTLMNRYIEENALSCLEKKSSIKSTDKEEIKNLLKELINNS